MLTLRNSLILLLSASFGLSLPARAQTVSADELAAKLKTSRQDGTSYIRLRLETNGGGSIQIQSKQRHTAAGSEVIYQVLFPKERKGESVLLKKPAQGAPSGIAFVPPDQDKKLNATSMKQPLFGSDLTYEDMVENFFAWKSQAIAGQEDIGRTPCTILESKPAASDQSSYASVKSWIDTRRMVPLRVEKYNASGSLLVRIETTNVEKDDLGRNLPASLSVQRSGGGSTVLEGSRIKHGVSLTDADFTAEALRDLSVPK